MKSLMPSENFTVLDSEASVALAPIFPIPYGPSPRAALLLSKPPQLQTSFNYVYTYVRSSSPLTSQLPVKPVEHYEEYIDDEEDPDDSTAIQRYYLSQKFKRDILRSQAQSRQRAHSMGGIDEVSTAQNQEVVPQHLATAASDTSSDEDGGVVLPEHHSVHHSEQCREELQESDFVAGAYPTNPPVEIYKMANCKISAWILGLVSPLESGALFKPISGSDSPSLLGADPEHSLSSYSQEDAVMTTNLALHESPPKTIQSNPVQRQTN